MWAKKLPSARLKVESIKVCIFDFGHFKNVHFRLYSTFKLEKYAIFDL